MHSDKLEMIAGVMGNADNQEMTPGIRVMSDTSGTTADGPAMTVDTSEMTADIQVRLVDRSAIQSCSPQKLEHSAVDERYVRE